MFNDRHFLTIEKHYELIISIEIEIFIQYNNNKIIKKTDSHTIQFFKTNNLEPNTPIPTHPQNKTNTIPKTKPSLDTPNTQSPQPNSKSTHFLANYHLRQTFETNPRDRPAGENSDHPPPPEPPRHSASITLGLHLVRKHRGHNMPHLAGCFHTFPHRRRNGRVDKGVCCGRERHIRGSWSFP